MHVGEDSCHCPLPAQVLLLGCLFPLLQMVMSRTGILPTRGGPYSEVDCTDAEYQRAVGRFLSAKDQAFVVSGSIPVLDDNNPTTLFFRTSVRPNRLSHSHTHTPAHPV